MLLSRRTRSFAAALILTGPLRLDPAHAASDGMPSSRTELDAYIRDYLMRNPEAVRDALHALEADEQIANTKRVLRDVKDEIYAAGSPELGNPDAKVTIVEFFDYNCPYCRVTYRILKEFLRNNPDTKLVLKDVASLGKESEKVARVALAVAKQANFAAFHDALMTQKGQVTETRALDIAAKLGFDMERLKKDAAASETGEALTRTQELADRLSVNTTPLYLVGHSGIAGSPNDLVQQLTALANTIREKGCDVC